MAVKGAAVATIVQPSDGDQRALDAFVDRCRRRDPAALESLYRQHVEAIYRHMRVLLRDDDVEDAVQLVFAEAFRGIASFGGRSTLSTWLHGIAYRVALKQLRSKRRRRQALLEYARSRFIDSVDAERTVSAREQAGRVQRLLEEVKPERQLAFALYYIEDLEIREVADRMNVSVDNAWARVKRARADLLELMRKQSARAARRARSVGVER